MLNHPGDSIPHSPCSGEKPATVSSSLDSSKSSSTLDNDNDSQRLRLPEYYTDRDFEKLLTRVITSPKLLASNPMVNVLPTTPATTSGTQSLSQFSTESQMASAYEDPMAENGESANEGGRPSAEKVSEPTALVGYNIDGINDFEAEPSSPETTVEDQAEDSETETQKNLAIAKYEKAEDEQIRKLMAVVTPLPLMIGTNRQEICIACFHMGHHHTEFDSCPAARINSLFTEEYETFYNRFPEKAEAHRWLMKDLAWCCQGLSWAINYICQGYLREFQILPSTVARLRALLGRWKTVCHNEKFTFGKFGECGGELIFGEPIKIPLIERDGGPYQVILQGGIPVLKPSRGKDAETADNFVNSFSDPKFQTSNTQLAKQKTDHDADRHQLGVIGNRPASVCPNCLYRGHAKNSVKICPYLIVSLAIEKLKKGRKRTNSITKELECLQNVVDKMVEPDERTRVEPIVSLITEWKDVLASCSKKGKKSSIPLKPLQFINTPSSFTSHRPPNILLNDPLRSLHSANQLVSPDYLSLTPFHDQDYTQSFPNSFPRISEASPPPLNSPFDESGNLMFYNTPLRKRHSVSPPPQGSSQYSSNLRHESTGFAQGTNYSFPELDAEFEDDELMVDQEEMQALFSDDLDTPMPNISQPLSTDDSHPPSQITNSNDPFGFSLYPKQNLANHVNSVAGQFGQPTNAGTTPGQQSNPLGYERNSSNTESNPIDNQLPAEISWRTRCPLKLIGSRGDSFCKACLHYGHDKRSQSCLVNVVRIAITTNKLHGMLEISDTIKELEAGLKWQRSLPKEMQTDDGMIMNLIRRWKETVQSLRKEAEEQAEIGVDSRKPKRRPSRLTLTPVRQQQTSRGAATPTQHQVQMDHEAEYFASNVTHSPETQLSQALQSQSPRRIALGKHQMQSRTHSPAPLQRSLLPPSSSRQIPPQQSPQNQLLHHKQEVPTAPKGWAIDYSRMDSNLFSKISDYIITDGDLADGDKLRIDNQRMPPMLIIAIRKYVLPENSVQKNPSPQPAARQQHYSQSQGSSSSIQLSDIGQNYNNRIQTPKRKRN